MHFDLLRASCSSNRALAPCWTGLSSNSFRCRSLCMPHTYHSHRVASPIARRTRSIAIRKTIWPIGWRAMPSTPSRRSIWMGCSTVIPACGPISFTTFRQQVRQLPGSGRVQGEGPGLEMLASLWAVWFLWLLIQLNWLCASQPFPPLPLSIYIHISIYLSG